MDPGAMDRMWQHALHLDTMLFQRANLFLVVESLLIVAYTLVLRVTTQAGNTGTAMALMVVRIIAVFGLFLTVIWGYVAHRHLRYTLQQPPSQEMADQYGVTALFFIVTAERARLARLARLADMIDSGKLKVSVAATFPLADGRAAYESGAIRRRRPGKTVPVVRDRPVGD
jgi:NADPH:quinone reductase-like Zn-dependent oxidoreductase